MSREFCRSFNGSRHRGYCHKKHKVQALVSNFSCLRANLRSLWQPVARQAAALARGTKHFILVQLFLTKPFTDHYYYHHQYYFEDHNVSLHCCCTAFSSAAPPLLYGKSYLKMKGAVAVLMSLNIKLRLIFSRRLLIYDHPSNIFPTFLFDFIHIFILLNNIVNFNAQHNFLI